jgi:hypothetical protein
LLDEWIFGRFCKLPILSRLVAQIITQSMRRLGSRTYSQRGSADIARRPIGRRHPTIKQPKTVRCANLNGGSWTRACGQIDSCRFPYDMHGPHSSHSNMTTSRDWQGIVIGDQSGHPRNLLPSYLRPRVCCQRKRIDGRRLGTARPFPLWRLHSGPQSSSIDQYSETPPRTSGINCSRGDAQIGGYPSPSNKNLLFNDGSNLAGQASG